LAAAALAATTGNAIVVITGAYDNAGAHAVTGVTDTAGNGYNRCGAVYTEGSNSQMEIWVAYNITGNASNVVTATWADGMNNRRILAIQYSGMLTSATPCDGAFAPAGAYDGSSPYTSTSANTAVNGEMVVGGYYSDSTLTYVASSPTSLRVYGTDYAGADNLIASAGAGTTALTSTTTIGTMIIARAFKPQ
jgi:hypothetical protein